MALVTREKQAMTTKTVHLFNARSGIFAAGAPGAGCSDDAFGAGREKVWHASNGLSAGWVRWQGRGESAAFSHTETLVVTGGRLRLRAGGIALDLAAGDGAVINRGANIVADADDGTSWVFCATSAANASVPGLIAIDRSAALSPSAPPPPQFVEGETPLCHNVKVFEDSKATFRAGVWSTTPHTRLSRPHPVHELMYILEGRAEVTDGDGTKLEIGPGDAIFVAHGTVNQLALKDPLKKIFVIAEY
jgi:uncharacterized cupin superfamily protein